VHRTEVLEDDDPKVMILKHAGAGKNATTTTTRQKGEGYAWQ